MIILSAVTAAMDKHVHPNGSAKNKKAEGPRLTQADITAMKDEVCLRNAKGRCHFDDGCYRQHKDLTPAEIKALEKEVNPASNSDNGEEGVCCSFQANGACTFGDKCKFSHDQTAKSHSAVSRAPLDLPTPARVGDLVIIVFKSCPAPLVGVLGQVHSSSGKRTRMQLIVPDQIMAAGGTEIRQWVLMADLVGLTNEDFIKCPPDMALHSDPEQSDGEGNNGGFSYNAIFDTGSDHVMSSAYKLFTNLILLPKPMNVDTSDGLFFLATHMGTITMRIGDHIRVFDDALYSKDCPHTMVPGTKFDSDGYSFMGNQIPSKSSTGIHQTITRSLPPIPERWQWNQACAIPSSFWAA